MRIRRLVRSSIITATIILVGAVLTNPVMADPVTIQLGSLTGTVDPITYTTVDGTFTTSTITLTLSMSSPSFFTIDPDTGVITAHTVMDVSFNNGRGTDLFGTLTVDEVGTLGPDPILMQITNGVLIGAGEFNGTTVSGMNTTFIDRFIRNILGREIIWQWRFPEDPEDPRRPIFTDLPSGFIDGDNIPTSGQAVATPVPEPTSLVLLGAGLAGIAIKKRKGLKSHKSRERS